MQQNMFIIPFTTESDYRNNVDSILSLLKEKTTTEEIILTEGEYSYIHNSHDTYEYSKKYSLNHRNHRTLASMINDEHSPWKDVKYIVCIGTWSTCIVSNVFSLERPDLITIHIQGPVESNMYNRDKFENLEKFNITLEELSNLLKEKFKNE